MSSPVITVTLETELCDALDIMGEKRISALIVESDGVPVGIFTERDAVLIAYNHGSVQSATVRDIMGTPLLTAPADLDYREGYRLITKHQKRHLVVVGADGQLEGIVTEGGFLKHLGTEFLVKFKEVGSLMTPDVVALPRDASVDDAVRLMARKRISCVVVEERGSPVGMLTERDIVQVDRERLDIRTTAICKVMASPVFTIASDARLPDAIHLMDREGIRRLVVVNGQLLLVGLITRHDIVRQLYDRHVDFLLETLRQRERELAETEARQAVKEAMGMLRNIVDQTGDATAVINAMDGRLMFVNKQACIDSGFSSDELIGRSAGEFSSWFQEQSVSEWVEKIRTGQKLRTTSIQRRSDGSTYPAEVKAHYVSSPGGDYVVATARDISARIAVEESLQASEQKVRTITSLQPVAVFRNDADGNCVFVNETTERFMGRPATECLGNGWVQALHPEDRARVRTDWRRALNSKETFHCEYRFLHADDRIVWVIGEAVPEVDDQGRLLGFTGALTDVTEKKRVEQVLQTRIERYELIADGANDAIWDWDLVDRHVYYSRRWKELRGYRDAEIDDSENHWREGIHADDAARVHAALDDYFEGRSDQFEEEYRVRCRSGEWKWVLNRGVVQWNEEGRPIRMAGSEMDITQRKVSERQLQESERRFRSIFEQASVGMALIDSQTGEFLRINHHYCDMIGYSVGEMTNAKTFMEITHPDDLALYLANMDRLRNGDVSAFSLEKRYFHKSGDTVWVRLNVSATWCPGEEPTNHIAVVEDITESKVALGKLTRGERLLKESQEMALIGSFEQHVERDIVYWTPELYNILGFDPENGPPSYEEFASRIEPEDRKIVDARVERAFQEGVPSNVLYRYNLPGGVQKIIRARARISLDGYGKPEWLRGTAQDVTAELAVEEAMRESERRLSTLMSNLPGMAYRCRRDSDWTMEFVSEGCRALTGYGPDTLLKNAELAYKDLIHEDDRQRVSEEVNAGVDAGRAFELVYRIRRSDGELRWVWEQGQSVGRDEPREFLEGFIADITERREAEERLRLTDRVMRNTVEGVVVTDRDASIVSVNKAFERITGYQETEVIGENPSIMQSGREDAGFYREFWRALTETGHWRGEIWNRRKNGEIYPEWLTVSAVEDREGRVTHYVGIFSDISRLKESQAKLDFLAHHDPLTELPNRVLFRDRLNHALSRVKRAPDSLAVLFFDLDRFKSVNDTLGHPIGDELLTAVSQRMLSVTRDGDTLARLGGDEFILLLEEGAASEQATTVARKLLKSIAEPLEIGGQEMVVTASVGISLYPDNGTDADTLIRHADLAMYEAKKRGRNTFQFFTQALTDGAFERLIMENALRSALDRQEFVLYYQPQLDLRNSELVGMEALIRWQHPELGLIPPGRFIHLAEEIGVINQIGLWVLETACRQLAQWDEEGFYVPHMSVNLSGRQIVVGDLVEAVREVFSRHDIAPARIEMEVTESMLMDDLTQASETLKGLKEIGVELAIDDFGTGFSSLSYLKNLPIDRLKIDQSFVRDIGRNTNDEAIVKAIIGLAASLGLETVAEGIEAKYQVEFLKAEGAQIGQGYLCGYPLPADEIRAKLEEGAEEI